MHRLVRPGAEEGAHVACLADTLDFPSVGTVVRQELYRKEFSTNLTSECGQRFDLNNYASTTAVVMQGSDLEKMCPNKETPDGIVGRNFNCAHALLVSSNICSKCRQRFDFSNHSAPSCKCFLRSYPMQCQVEPASGVIGMADSRVEKMHDHTNKHCRNRRNLAMRLFRRGYSSSQSSSSVPQSPVPPPAGWEYPFFDEPPLMRTGPPGYLEPDFAKTLKSVPGIVPEVCLDESAFLVNYEPWEFIKAFPLFRKHIIHGSKPDKHGVMPTILLPNDGALYMMNSLPSLARFFHEHGCCLPRLSMSDLVITGAGKFRLRGSDIAFREFTLENVQDVYMNISSLFTEMLSVSVEHIEGTKLPADFADLKHRMGNFNDSGSTEYLIGFNSFFIPLGNKAHALLRAIDLILDLPKASKIQDEVLLDLPHIDVGKEDRWFTLAEGNDYLKQWLGYREYGPWRLEFLRFVRAVICHKVKYGLPDKFVDFLVYATYPTLLSTLQSNLWSCGMLKQLQFEELFPQNMPSHFVDWYCDDSAMLWR